MSTATYAVRDSATMPRRDLRHMARYPSVTLMPVGLPLLFVYVFGGTMGAGPPGSPSGDRGDHLTFITPGILTMAVASVSSSTAVSVAADMTDGIIDRFRTMAIAKVPVLTGSARRPRSGGPARSGDRRLGEAVVRPGRSARAALLGDDLVHRGARSPAPTRRPRATGR